MATNNKAPKLTKKAETPVKLVVEEKAEILEGIGTQANPTEDAPVTEAVETETIPEIKSTVTFDRTIKAPPDKTQVRILMGDNYKGHIGGVRYNLERGKCYNVPENLKRILSEIKGMLLPL